MVNTYPKEYYKYKKELSKLIDKKSTDKERIEFLTIEIAKINASNKILISK